MSLSTRLRADDIPESFESGVLHRLGHGSTSAPVTWQAFGLLSDEDWAEIIRCVPKKDGVEDLDDPTKLGRGHLNKLEALWHQAQQDVAARFGDTPGATSSSDDEVIAYQGDQDLPMTDTADAHVEEEMREATDKADRDAQELLVVAKGQVAQWYHAGRGRRCIAHTDMLDAQWRLEEARRLLAASDRTAHDAVIALGVAQSVTRSIPYHERKELKIENGAYDPTPVFLALRNAEKRCRDVMVWRVQLASPIGRRDLYVAALKGVTPPSMWIKDFESSALHAHRAEVAKLFPAALLKKRKSRKRARHS